MAANNNKQLLTLLKFEQSKEEKAENALRNAENDYQQNLTRLQSVSDYRLEYMSRLSERTALGLDSATYNHYHAFINKLDNAAEQVKIAMNQAKALVEQSKELWIKQRQKVQAVEMLTDKRNAALMKIESKKEQSMFDEISTQQFLRRKSNY
ncbi:flagellar export protein FliJ [Colwellia sp. 4_MG-2023]|jgi:flagellar FliJ protein|uniref:flagellar export protein FliJ n=1 Tax=unclassified Colwellia TaxID=196834 RepID=UPI001C09BF8A|nr:MULTISPECIES: flagellar export protein FliJ [unclassified Colwellia]MBU2925295.1 flagellar export protein FliJ [Colwellia sp. C2M11]MDO6486767.1 flagellar export protein FliJ [Colwellia sp. 6_MG-2023]MDO6506953.1 flagellar export protein FliJ [Colwellia sp. 5_MG-2023]MDO6556609.1 flagellar export protein FliJ [Colwellia sp. 4_MG-2023]MDO6651180.1 flagellar export protein FliJ [Colwellia sp. 3_MG-2023]